jgi:hypothetical protein
MFSFFVSDTFGFGCSWTQTQYDKINAAKKAVQPNHAGWKAPYPGIDSLNYGKNREGWWKSEDFLQQLDDFTFAVHVLTDDKYQIVMEVDSSSNHLAKKTEGLGARSLNTGGKQGLMRPSILTIGCIDPSNAIYPPTLRIGDTQYMQFREGDSPPWYAPTMRKYDLRWSDMTAEEKAEHQSARDKLIASITKKVQKKKGNKRSNRFTVQEDAVPGGQDELDAAAVAEVEFVIYGYVGKPKGMKQLLWERGKWRDGMHGTWDTKRRQTEVAAGRVIDDTLDAQLVLLSCPDFQNENTLIADLLDARNDIVLLSPKCHPELAGCGVEYCIGRSKMLFRRQFNDSSNARLYENSMRAINGVELEMVWKYGRRARDYLHVYRILDEQGLEQDDGVFDMTGESKMTWKLLEDMRKERKTHRNIMEIEERFLALDLAPKGSGIRRNRIDLA